MLASLARVGSKRTAEFAADEIERRAQVVQAHIRAAHECIEVQLITEDALRRRAWQERSD